MYKRPWDVSRTVNRPSGVNFALEIFRNGHTNNGKPIFQKIFLSFIKCCFLLFLWYALPCFGVLWHALQCFGMIWHALSCKERDPRAQGKETPGHKGMGPQGHKGQINREAGGPTGTRGSAGRSPPVKYNCRFAEALHCNFPIPVTFRSRSQTACITWPRAGRIISQIFVPSARISGDKWRLAPGLAKISPD